MAKKTTPTVPPARTNTTGPDFSILLFVIGMGVLALLWSYTKYN